jgi:hypothetical protein
MKDVHDDVMALLLPEQPKAEPVEPKHTPGLTYSSGYWWTTTSYSATYATYTSSNTYALTL